MSERTGDGPAVDATRVRPGPGETTVCPFCAVGCTLRPRGPAGAPAEGVPGPANPDGHLCRKGIAAVDRLADADRLTRPLVRRDGELVPTDWDEALDTAASLLEGVLDEYGPDALAFLGAPHSANEANYRLQKLARTLGTNNVDNRSRLCHASGMTALEDRLGRAAMANSMADLASADVFVVVGANPAVQQPVAFDSFVRPAVDSGATLVHVDPRRNRTTRLADVHLAPRPGADALVATLLAAVVREAGLIDRSYVAERTRDVEPYLDQLDALDVTAEAERAGVDPDDLRRVGRTIGGADRVAVLAGTGIDSEDPEETTTPDALLNLLLLTGNVGRPGTGLHVLRGPTNEQGATDVGCRPDRLPGHRPVTDQAARAALAEAWGIEPPATPGLDERTAVERFGRGIHGALVVGENPVVEKRDAGTMRERLEALDALVVVDPFETETAAFADVVLPAAAGLETAGTVTNLDRRVQRREPVLEAPGEARPDLAILGGLGRRLVGDAFAEDDPAVVFEELTRVSQLHDGMTLDAVADGGVQWPARADGDGTAVLYEQGFETADGRAAFVTIGLDGRPPTPDGLALVVGGRAGGDDPEEGIDRRVHLHAADAETRGIADGDAVVVAAGDATVETTAAVEGRVREGTAALHADIADPLVRADAGVVDVEPVDDGADRP